MRIVQLILLFIVLSLGQFSIALSNRMARFSIQHCARARCLTARGDDAFLSYNGRLVAADNVTLEIQRHGRTRVYKCLDFRGDMKRNRYVCDNREGRDQSLTVDSDLQVTYFAQ